MAFSSSNILDKVTFSQMENSLVTSDQAHAQDKYDAMLQRSNIPMRSRAASATLQT